MSFKIVPLSKDHIRENFNCGVTELDIYIKKYALQDTRRNLASLFVAVRDDMSQVFGYYTLSNASVIAGIIPGPRLKKLSVYKDVPAIRLGRLAVDRKVQGQGLGTRLLANAVIRSTSNVSAWTLMVVDAKDESAAAFYRRFGFESLKDDTKHLFAQRKDLESLFTVT